MTRGQSLTRCDVYMSKTKYVQELSLCEDEDIRISDIEIVSPQNWQLALEGFETSYDTRGIRRSMSFDSILYQKYGR